MEADNPSWHLLPHDAPRFFGLHEKFDRKDLKRAYGKFVRQFKPEKFPDEFQRIRAAYETLDQQLRHRQTPPHRDELPLRPVRSTVEIVPNKTDQAEHSTLPPPSSQVVRLNRDFRQRLKREKPADLYRELKRRAEKTPYDFFALAILSDVVTEDANRFYKWLLLGLKVHPHALSLFNLLREYLRSEIPIEWIPQQLLEVSKVVQDDRFYYLTESAWQRLLRSSEFNVFKSTLKRCENNLRDFHNHAQIAFYVKILRVALWKADADWSREKLQWLQSNDNHLSPQLELDFYTLDLIQDYQRIGKPFADASPIRKQIALAIEGYFCHPPDQADPNVIQCQLNLAEDAEALLDEFPVEIADSEIEAAAVFWPLWQIITIEVAQRHDIDMTPDAPLTLSQHVLALMNDLNTRWAASQSQVFMYGLVKYIFPIFALIVVSLAVTIASVIALGGQQFVFSYGLLGFVNAFLSWAYWGHVFPRWLRNHFHDSVANAIKAKYSQLWRSRLTQFLDANDVIMRDLAQALYDISVTPDTKHYAATHLSQIVANDLGVAIYAQAVRFRV